MTESDPSEARDAYHLRLLAVFHYILAGFGAVNLLYTFIINVLMRGDIEKMQESVAAGAQSPLTESFQHFSDEITLVMTVWGIISVILNSLAGLCLQRGWLRGVLLAVSAFNLLNIPLGTVLAIFTLLVLMRPSVRARFAAT